MATSKCRGCGKDIIWQKSEQGKSIPFDARPTVVMVADANGYMTVTRGHVSHFATCPKASQMKKPEETQAQPELFFES